MATEIPASTTRPYPQFFPDPFHHTLADLLEPEQRASMYPAPQPTLAGVLRGSGVERTPSVPAPLRERPMLAVVPHAWSETDGRGLEYIKSGPVVGFVYWAPEYQFLVFFQRLRLKE